MTLEVAPTTLWQAYALKIHLPIPKVIASNCTIGKWDCVAAELASMHRVLKYLSWSPSKNGAQMRTYGI